MASQKDTCSCTLSWKSNGDMPPLTALTTRRTYHPCYLFMFLNDRAPIVPSNAICQSSSHEHGPFLHAQSGIHPEHFAYLTTNFTSHGSLLSDAGPLLQHKGFPPYMDLGPRRPLRHCHAHVRFVGREEKGFHSRPGLPTRTARSSLHTVPCTRHASLCLSNVVTKIRTCFIEDRVDAGEAALFKGRSPKGILHVAFIYLLTFSLSRSSPSPVLRLFQAHE